MQPNYKLWNLSKINQTFSKSGMPQSGMDVAKEQLYKKTNLALTYFYSYYF